MSSLNLPEARSLDPGRELPLGGQTLDLVREFESPYGDRMTPVTTLEAALGRRHSLPEDTLVFRGPDELAVPVAIHCPLTAVPFTQRMADSVDLSHDQLQAMVDRKVPLGLTKAKWRHARLRIFDVLDDCGLLDDALVIKAGGSSVSGFSSRATSLKKKSFPASEDELLDKVNARGRAHSHVQDRINVHAVNALDIYREIGLDRKPRAPWWGVMHLLGLEHAPDVDVQLWSPKLDEALGSHSDLAHHMPDNNSNDRWGRWFDHAIFHAYPALGKLQRYFQREGIHVDLEFLAGANGQQRISERTDWWDVRPPANDLVDIRTVSPAKR